ncbi:MAG TPA: glycosyltransferase family 4 protein [Candidatus Eisenbacteria bacterium]|nr:glycosyltransferase family 4 protein [Candidatus Eisenbacteria bacterium]
MTATLLGRRVALVGPIPPPFGGMANQTKQLHRLLEASGASVEFVATNPPYRPAWVERLKGIRAFLRLAPYCGALRSAAGRADVAHVMASSGWAWHFFAAPAIWIFSWRGVPVIVNYRGGAAEDFFSRGFAFVRPTLSRAAAIVVPSPFLQRVFAARGFEARVVPNVVDRALFAPAAGGSAAGRRTPLHLVVARNLEPIYDVGTAIRAFARVREALPGARLSIAGMGPERGALERLASELAPAGSIVFTGRLENESMATLYRTADAILNPSLVDNMPISILEALSAGIPVVSTDAGGIPDVVTNEVQALLVPPRDPEAMAAAVLRLEREPGLRERLVAEGLRHVERFTWDRVGPEWAAVYAASQP